MYGGNGDRLTGSHYTQVLSIVIACSAYGTVLSVLFSHARINQAVASDGIVPFARHIVATSRFGTPLNAILLHYVVSLAIIIAAPPGDAYNMIISGMALLFSFMFLC